MAKIAYKTNASQDTRLCENLLDDMLKVPDENRPNNWLVPSLVMQKSQRNNVKSRDLSIVNVNQRISSDIRTA